MKKLIIQALQKSDEAWLKEIYKQSKKELGSFNLYQCWDFYLSGQNKENFIGVEPMGFVRWKQSKKYGGNLIMDIAVHKDYRGKGVGYFLLKQIPLPVILKCNCDNKVGNDFYARAGMQKAGVTFTKKGVKQNIWILK